MSLAHRIIPVVLCRGRQMVKGEKFNSWRSVGVAEQAVRIHAARGVDEVCLLDISATLEGRGPALDLVRELSASLFVPLTIGGGIRSVTDIRALLRAGADKVVIGAAADEIYYEKAPFIRQASQAVGSQGIVVAIDVKDGLVYTRGGHRNTSWLPSGYARLMEKYGAGELLLTSIAREGTMQGYDLELVREVSAAVGIPVIAHGGCGSYEHMEQAIQAGASAVAAGAFFQFSDSTPQGAAEYLQAHGIEARL